MVADHALFPAHVSDEQRIDPQHLPSPRRRVKTQWLRERFAQWGETGSRFLEGLPAKQRYARSQSEERLDQLLAEGQRAKLSGLEILERVLAEPAGSRQERAVARRIREAKFHDSATLESFDWTFNAKTISRDAV